MREKAYKVFLEKSKLEETAKARYKDPAVIEAAMRVGKTLGQTISGEDLTDQEYVEGIRDLVLTIAPQKMLVDVLHDLSEEAPSRTLEIVAKLFRDAKIAEGAALGQIARERIGSITRLEEILSAHPPETERPLQELLESAPWLIDPEWTVLQTNERFENLRTGFQRWYLKEKGEEIVTTTVGTAKDRKPDFIMLHLGRGVEIVEIKKTEWALIDKEFDRIVLYLEVMTAYLKENPSIGGDFPRVHITLVCDGLNLGGTASIAYQGLLDRDILERKTWEELLNDTKKVHESFLKAYKEIGPQGSQ